MYQHQRQTNGESGKVICGAIGLCCCTQHHQYEHAGEDDLCQQTAEHGHISLQVVSTRTLQTRHVLCQHKEQQTADKGTDHLEQHIHAAILTADTSCQETTQGDGGIDMTTADTTDGISHRHHCQSEGKSRTHHSGDIVYRITTQTDGYAATHQYEHHRAHHFCKILFHNHLML